MKLVSHNELKIQPCPLGLPSFIFFYVEKLGWAWRQGCLKQFGFRVAIKRRVLTKGVVYGTS